MNFHNMNLRKYNTVIYHSNITHIITRGHHCGVTLKKPHQMWYFCLFQATNQLDNHPCPKSHRRKTLKLKLFWQPRLQHRAAQHGPNPINLFSVQITPTQQPFQSLTTNWIAVAIQSSLFFDHIVYVPDISRFILFHHFLYICYLSLTPIF